MRIGRLLAWQSWDYGALALRVVLSLVMITHGSQKVFGAFGGRGPAAWVEAVGGMGFWPAPFWAGLVMLTEVVGGLLTLLGIATEVGALLFAGDMLVAIWKMHWQNGFFNRDGGIEFTLLLFTIALALVLGGPGRYALWNPFRREE